MTITFPKSRLTIIAALVLAVALIALSVLHKGASADTSNGAPSASAAFAERFPETSPDELSCDGFGPLCQVVAGKTVFYVDPEARHAFIGRLYDLDAKVDLTEATLKRIAPAEMSAAGSVQSDAASSIHATKWSDLPFDSAILRNRGGALKVAVFSDVNCGYCRHFSKALEAAPDIEAHEFLIGVQGSEAQSRAIGCAEDPESALHAYYETRSVPDIPCDRDIVEPARAAARSLGAAMQGTPTFVRPDGAVTSGFRDIQTLRAWLLVGADSEGAVQ